MSLNPFPINFLMRVIMSNKTASYRTVWFDDNLYMIDQNQLPFKFEVKKLTHHSHTAAAIRDMTVRGAPAIGATAAYGMAQAFLHGKNLEQARHMLASTRPTARNLFYALERVAESDRPLDEAHAIAEEEVNASKRIGEYGDKLIKDGANIMTHCNAGWLACVDWGTAIAPIYRAHRNGKELFVYVSETRPRLQGARLTAWELHNEQVHHTIISDNASAHFMQQGDVDLIIVGADRIAANGDTANKIGTLEKAIVANEFKVPFYIAAPLSTVDVNCENGKKIPIEERSQDEVLYAHGVGRAKQEKVRIASPGSTAKNPAFDVTPAKFIKGIITEKGIVKPSEIGSFAKRQAKRSK